MSFGFTLTKTLKRLNRWGKKQESDPLLPRRVWESGRKEDQANLQNEESESGARSDDWRHRRPTVSSETDESNFDSGC